MTKSVHIINGDTTKYKVSILVQEKVFEIQADGTYIETDEWKTFETLLLDNPGQLLTKYITSTRRLVIEENGIK